MGELRPLLEATMPSITAKNKGLGKKARKNPLDAGLSEVGAQGLQSLLSFPNCRVEINAPSSTFQVKKRDSRDPFVRPKFENMKITKKRTGFRAYDDDMAKARLYAQSFEGSDLKKGRVLAALKQAAPGLGINRRIIDLLDELFAFSDASDWKPGRTPIVWPSNQLLSDKLGVEIRQVQIIIRNAIKAGLLHAIDSPTGKRYGYRDPDTRRIVKAYGFSLAPVGARYVEFLEQAAWLKEQRERRSALNARKTVARKIIMQICTACIEDYAPGDWRKNIRSVQSLLDSIRKTKDLDALEEDVVAMEELRAEVEINFDRLYRVDDSEQNKKDSCDHESNDMPITTTTQPRFSKKTCSALQERSSGENSEPKTEFKREEKFLGSENTFQSYRTQNTIHVAEGDLDDYKISADMALTMLSEPSFDIAPEHKTWQVVRGEAENLLYKRKVNEDLWRDLVNHAGHRAASLAVIVAARKFDNGLVKNLGGYLRGMSQQAKTGNLRLGRSVYGLLEKAKKGQGHNHDVGF